MDAKARPLWRRILVLFVIPLGILLIGAGVIYPEWRDRIMTSNEIAAASTLKTLSTAEADYRANDRDGNKILDFWTADVAELSRLGMLPKPLGLADGSPRVPLAEKAVPYNGYYFEALETDDSTSPSEPYRRDTDGKSGKVHNLQRFGFMAYPAIPGVTGRCVYIVNENNSVWYSRDATRKPQAWPSDDELKNEWCRVCGG